jgi:gamma-glutamyltranspeptidase
MAKEDSFAGVRIPRSPVYGAKGMVVSGHSMASMAGLRVLERGGNVIDAMIATSAVLCVILPHATSLGGDAFIMYHSAKTGETEGLNASGHAPAGATTEFFKDGMESRGPLAFSIPGIVRGWEEIHKKHGSLPWKELFKDAIAAAECHPMSRVIGAALHLFRTDVEADPGCSALYYPGGEPLKGGDLLRQPVLADTLREIAESGSAPYYEGRIGKSIGDYSQANGGLASAADFEGYKPEWVTPLETDYRGRSVRVMPPNSYGLLMLMQLNALSGLSSEDMAGDEATRVSYLMRAMRSSFAEGQHHIADPRTNPAPIDELLGDAMTARLQDAVLTGTHPSLSHPAGGTSCITIADASGDAVTVVQSVFHVFGGAFLDPGTGILMNNRMTGFVPDPSHASCVAPNKRPSHTLNPVVVLENDKVRYLMTTPGGPAQTITNVQILTNMIDRGMELSAAIEEPRWSINLDGTALLDDVFSVETADKLADMGFPSERATGSSYFGSAKMMEILPNGVMAGAADGRREANAVGF